MVSKNILFPGSWGAWIHVRKDLIPNNRVATRLTAALQKNEQAILAIPGVTGCGVGFADAHVKSAVVIQIFVRSPNCVDEVQKMAREILGQNPVQVVVMPLPAAD